MSSIIVGFRGALIAPLHCLQLQTFEQANHSLQLGTILFKTLILMMNTTILKTLFPLTSFNWI